jgi:ubiquinone/menaquinone biosynthesis C-methylase UbiE
MAENVEYVNFNNYAGVYDDTRAVSPEILSLFGKKLKEFVPNFQNLLEIACGTGRITQGLVENNFSVTGIDVAEKMLEKAIQKSKTNYWFFNGILADTRFIPLKKQTFDIILTVHILHLIKDWEKVMKELLRCLTQNGAYIFGDFSRKYHNSPPFIHYWKYLNENFNMAETLRIGAKSQREVENFMKKNGFKSQYYGYKDEISIKKERLIDLVNGRYFSGQRNVKDNQHIEVINHLKRNNYFLPKNENEVQLEEEFKIWMFTK